MQSELPNLINILAKSFKDIRFAEILLKGENIFFSFLAAVFLILIFGLGCRRLEFIPKRTQAFFEALAEGVDNFVCGLVGPKGRRLTPFIGSLFFYIIVMNLLGIIPFMKSPTASWSITLGLALCVFFYVQLIAIKELGLKGYIYHLMGQPKGFLAFSVVIPLLMFLLHILTELIRPLSLSLRLRSNIWGDDVLLTLIAGLGLKGIPLLLFNTLTTIIGSVVQAVVFCLLATIYFALVMPHGEERLVKDKKGG